MSNTLILSEIGGATLVTKFVLMPLQVSQQDWVRGQKINKLTGNMSKEVASILVHAKYKKIIHL